MVVFLLLILSFFGGVSLYLARRVFQGLCHFFPGLHFGFVLGFFLLMTVLMLLGFGSSMLPLSQGVRLVLQRIGMYWMGIFIYLLLFTILADVVTLGLRLWKAPVIKGSLFRAVRTLCVVGLALVTVLYALWHADRLQQVSYSVSIENKTDVSDMKIVLISDLHLGAIKSEQHLPEIVDSINRMEPDLICIAGDFFDTDFGSIRDPEAAKAQLQRLSATYGVYACLGNHDAGQTTGKMQSFLADCNITLLREESTVIDGRLVLVGRLDGSPIGGYDGVSRGQMADCLTDIDPGLPVVVLDHNPGHIHEYGEEADLILCGHTHKGQMFPANLLTGMMYTVDYGHYVPREGPQTIVTSGVGYWGMPMRLGTDCEIVQIQIVSTNP